jgi:hypothetical protein
MVTARCTLEASASPHEVQRIIQGNEKCLQAFNKAIIKVKTFDAKSLGSIGTASYDVYDHYVVLAEACKQVCNKYVEVVVQHESDRLNTHSGIINEFATSTKVAEWTDFMGTAPDWGTLLAKAREVLSKLATDRARRALDSLTKEVAIQICARC